MNIPSETREDQSKDLLLDQTGLPAIIKLFVEKAGFEVLPARGNIEEATAIIKERLSLNLEAFITLLSDKDRNIFDEDLTEFYRSIIRSLERQGTDRQIIRNQILIICSDNVSRALRSSLGDIYGKRTKKMITPAGDIFKKELPDLANFLTQKRDKIRQSK